jgi:ssDNA-binding replication factor A large subunit
VPRCGNRLYEGTDSKLGETQVMSGDDLIHAILGKFPEVTEAQVLAAIETEKNKTGGLIADETLLRLIALRYGVEISREAVSDCKLSISHLIPNLNRVTVSGRVVAVFPAKTFEGSKPGKYASVLIADQNGVLRVMLWNGKADVVESGLIEVGQVARFLRGYTREDRNGKVELHISEKGGVEVEPEDLVEQNYPLIDHFVTAIKDVTLLQQSVHLAGKVKAMFASSVFTRQDGSGGKVLRFTVADRTGEVAVVAWNGKAEKLEATLRGDVEVKLINAKVRSGQNGGGLEVHVDESTFVEVLPASEQR